MAKNIDNDSPGREFVGLASAGVTIQAPNRLENVAQLIARQDAPADRARLIAVVRRAHRLDVARKILDRAETIRQARAGQRCPAQEVLFG